MDTNTSVSAFAMYKTNKQSNKDKKNKKKKNRASAKLQNNIPEEIVFQAAKKIKNQVTKPKTAKEGVKKKLHKKKKTKSRQVKETTIDNLKTSSSVPQSGINVNGPAAPVLLMDDMLCKSSDDEGSHCDHQEYPVVETDSPEEGLKVFKWMIAPYDVKQFFNNIWEKQPLVVSRKKPAYYKDIISTPAIDDMLRNEFIQFTKNIDITSYVDGKRETHNPEGRAHPHLVWDFYLNGCSIRLLNPQTYISKLHLLNATLQEFFNSFVGANAYLTPPDSQGFAPHYDDIEAFILQIEGKKHWRIYKPLSDNEVLPRVSSKNFDQEEIGEPIMEVDLEAGDMLYFPRGYIHQGVTIDGEHSLHVTVSMYQKHSWADLFEKLVPAALQLAINENVDLRRGLPLDIYDNFGIVHADSSTPRREEITNLVMSLFDKIRDHLPIDDAVDQMHKNFQHDALPPVLNEAEKAVTVFGDSDLMIENGKVVNRVEIGLDDSIRLLRKNILRMVSEDKIRLYYHVENSLEYHGNELPYLEIEPEFAPAVEMLITEYPNYVRVENLDLGNDTDKIQLVDALWSRGLVMTERAMEPVDDD